MNILIDFIPFQYNSGVSGAASFTKAVYDRLILSAGNVRLFATYDATMPSGLQYGCQEMADMYHAVLADISGTPLRDVISRHHIDVFFISIGQLYEKYDLNCIGCKTIMFIHDLFEYERCDNKVDLLIYDRERNGWKDWAKRFVNLFSGRWERQIKKRYSAVMQLYAARNTLAYTVSNYSRNALRYYFPALEKDIRICYSPTRTASMMPTIENEALGKLVASHKRYILMLAASRRYKNVQTLMKVFSRLREEYDDLYLLTLKYGSSVHPRHIDIPYLSDSDLEHAYKNAYVLAFTSYFEGFGYPPVEAMKYGTPTVASNVTSIPEILGDAAVYFSPFYSADLYRALKEVLQDRNLRNEQIQRRKEHIAQIQEEHLSQLIEEILTNNIP